MPYGDDISEGLPLTLSNPAGVTYTPTGYAYDVAIGGLPFFVIPLDDQPYRRVTAQYRKQQIDQSREPGEQTLTGWWIRSQSSFHYGQGIKFFEPIQDESLRFQYTESKGIDVWEKGQCTLLKSSTAYSSTTNTLQTNKRPYQSARSITYGTKEAVLVWDGFKVDKVEADGTVVPFLAYSTAYPIYSICDDGTFAYWITNGAASGTFEIYKKLLTGVAGAGDVLMFAVSTIAVTNAVIEFTKERLVIAVNNLIFELAPNATAFPATPVYTNPNLNFVYTSITSSGAAIYLTGYNGVQSNIQKFTLNTSGAMPTLTSAITAAELPVGEIVFKISYYLGYLLIGTNLGMRVAQVSDGDGSIQYGPLIFESTQPVYDFAFRDKYIWAASGVDGQVGVTRVDLGQDLGTLTFPYAWDLHNPNDTLGNQTTTCAFIGRTTRLAYVNNATNGNGSVYLESESTLFETGYLQTGYVRYNTLEKKIFKQLQARVNTTNGAITLFSVDSTGTEFNIGTFAQNDSVPEVNIAFPNTSQEYLGFKFVLNRSTTDSTKGPLFTGYQIKSLPAIPRQRLIQYPLMCYDNEMDKFNNEVGSEGSAYDRMSQIEAIENVGDTIRIDDFRTGESYIGLIEEMDFINRTPPDKRFSGFGGTLLVTIRSV